jgi:Cu(I)/Ag(I) efflux system membrane fusion protein
MFAEAVVRGSESDAESTALVIPETAPLFTGRRSLVYVEVVGSASPTYEAREVRLGPKMGDVYPVVAGLSEGERVVIHGAFTLDADLQIRGGLSMMALPDDAADGPYDQIVQVPAEYNKPMKLVIQSYLALHEALASDDLPGAQKAAGAIVSSSEALEASRKDSFREAWMPLRRHLSHHGGLVAKAGTLDAARTPFRDLSQQIATLLRVFGNPSEETVRLASCPMALGGEGGEWVQRASKIENPYFGASMHACGDIHKVVEHGTYLPLEGSGTTAPAPAQDSHAGHDH